MKSCLKHTPPVTPTLSASGTPNQSRNGSPRPEPLTPSIRKAVSFCGEDDGLEEVHEADDWDRSPTPMTPRLSYQDILELKQLQLTLPRAPSYRPFTGATPHTGHPPSSGPSKQPFPISRFAQAQSLTPSKWKNREESRVVDPDILPYLDAVPIQLLPLLPPSADTLDNQTPTSAEPSDITPSTSPPTPKSRPVSPPHIPAQPTLAAPTVAVSPPRVESPTTSTTPTPSPRRTANFTFLPLLPVQEPKPAPPPPPMQKAPEPKRKINMAFLPLMPVNETQLSERSVNADAPSKDKMTEPEPAMEVQEAPISHDVCSASVCQPPQLDANFDCPAPDSDSSYPYFRTPSPTSTPALSSASDTDTESEAPSTNNSNPPSPGEPEIMTVFSSSSSAHSGERMRDINPYFPILPQSSQTATPRMVSPNTRPGQTPPLSVIYPEYAEVGGLPTPSIDDSEVGLSGLVKKVQLQAIPSPSLIPPSPFSLYPPSKAVSPIEERFARSNIGSQGQPQSGMMTKRAFAAARSRSALSLSSIPIPPSLALEAEVQLGPSFSRRKESQDWS